MANAIARHGFAIEYTDEKFIPTNFDELGSFFHILEEIKKEDKLPFKKADVKYSATTWYLAGLTNNKEPHSQDVTLRFTNIPEPFVDAVKAFAYWNLTDNRKMKIFTLRGVVYRLKKYFEYLNGLYSKTIDAIDINTIQKYIEDLNNSGLVIKTIKSDITAIKDFYEFYNAHMTNVDLSHVIKFLKKALSVVSAMTQAAVENSKYSDIPNEYYNKFISTCIKLMDSENIDVDNRCMAALIIISSQTGLRTSQLCSLKANDVKKLTNSTDKDNPKTVYFMNFKVIKRQNLTGDEIAKTVLNELGYKAYKLIEELYAENRTERNVDYLFCPSNISTIVPLTSTTFNRYYKKFIGRYSEDLGVINVADKYPELGFYTFAECIKNNYVPKALASKYKDTDTITYPVIHQFRVHLCTDLYYKQIPLAFIKNFMNHLSEEMTDYYVRRPEHDKQKNEYANAILKTIIEDEVTPLGTGSDKFMVKIKEFLDEGNFNVEKDIDTIIANLKKKIPIKEKYGGICIKSNQKRECRYDSKGDEFYCAYGACPNHFHLYYMSDISYNKCKNLVKTFEYNKENGFDKQAQREKNKLVYVAKNSLYPELEQLKSQISKKGSEWIKEKYPNLISIIDNLEAIEKEVKAWMEM